MTRGVGAGRAVWVSTVGNFAGPAVALVTAPLLAHALGAEGRGDLAAATAPLLLGTSALTLGVPEAVTHAVAKQRDALGRVVRSGALLVALAGAVGSVLIWLLSPALGSGRPGLAAVVALTGVAVVPSLVVGVLRGAARGRGRWILVAGEQLLTALLRLGSVGALFLAHAITPGSVAAATAVSGFAGGLAYLLLVRPDEGRRGVDPAAETPTPLLRFGLGVWLGSIAGVLLSRLDQTLILPLSSAVVLGSYAVAVSITDFVRMFNQAVRDVVFSTQSRKSDDNKLALAARCATLLTLVTAVLVALLSIPVVPLLFGEEFASAVPAIAVILIGTVVGNPGSVLAAGISARGRPILRSIAICVGVLVDVAGVYLLVPVLGVLGAAIATAVSTAVTGLLVVVFARRAFGLSPKAFLVLRWSDVAVVAGTAKGVLDARLKRIQPARAAVSGASS